MQLFPLAQNLKTDPKNKKCFVMVDVFFGFIAAFMIIGLSTLMFIDRNNSVVTFTETINTHGEIVHSSFQCRESQECWITSNYTDPKCQGHDFVYNKTVLQDEIVNFTMCGSRVDTDGVRIMTGIPSSVYSNPTNLGVLIFGEDSIKPLPPIEGYHEHKLHISGEYEVNEINQTSSSRFDTLMDVSKKIIWKYSADRGSSSSCYEVPGAYMISFWNDACRWHRLVLNPSFIKYTTKRSSSIIDVINSITNMFIIWSIAGVISATIKKVILSCRKNTVTDSDPEAGRIGSTSNKAYRHGSERILGRGDRISSRRGYKGDRRNDRRNDRGDDRRNNRRKRNNINDGEINRSSNSSESSSKSSISSDKNNIR